MKMKETGAYAMDFCSDDCCFFSAALARPRIQSPNRLYPRKGPTTKNTYMMKKTHV